jgi:RNase P subunit RPR2
MKYVDKRKDNQKIAKERIEILRKMKAKYPEFAKRYDELIGRIAKKYRIPKEF